MGESLEKSPRSLSTRPELSGYDIPEERLRQLKELVNRGWFLKDVYERIPGSPNERITFAFMRYQMDLGPKDVLAPTIEVRKADKNVPITIMFTSSPFC